MTTYDVPNSPLNFTNVTDLADSPELSESRDFLAPATFPNFQFSCKNQATNTVNLKLLQDLYQLKKEKMEEEICK